MQICDSACMCIGINQYKCMQLSSYGLKNKDFCIKHSDIERLEGIFFLSDVARGLS